MPEPIKYSKLREVVKRLINEHYNTDASDSEIEATESRLIECATNGDFKIYVSVHVKSEKWIQKFKMPTGDLSLFIEKPRAEINIEELYLYTKATETIRESYYGEAKRDRNGIIPDCPEISKTYRISANSFQIGEEDIHLLAEKIKNDKQLYSKVGQGERKVSKQEKPEAKKKKLRGIKRHSVSPKELDKIFKEIIEVFLKESNGFIAKKAMVEIEKKHGRKPNEKPFYKEGTLKRMVSEFKNKKKKK